jgi:hypothetical protein
MKLNQIIEHSNHFSLVEICPYSGVPTVVGSTTWIRSFNAPFMGSKERARKAIEQKRSLGYFRDFN